MGPYMRGRWCEANLGLYPAIIMINPKLDNWKFVRNSSLKTEFTKGSGNLANSCGVFFMFEAVGQFSLLMLKMYDESF